MYMCSAMVRRNQSAWPAGAPAVAWADGMNRGELRRAFRVVTEQHEFRLARWEELHGRID